MVKMIRGVEVQEVDSFEGLPLSSSSSSSKSPTPPITTPTQHDKNANGKRKEGEEQTPPHRSRRNYLSMASSSASWKKRASPPQCVTPQKCISPVSLQILQRPRKQRKSLSPRKLNSSTRGASRIVPFLLDELGWVADSRETNSSKQKDLTIFAQSMSTEAQSVSAEAEFITVEAESITTKADSILTEAEFITTEAKCVIRESKSMSAEVEFITTESESITTEAESIIPESEFLTTESESITIEAESVSVEAENVITESESISAEAESVITEAEFITVEAESVIPEAENVITESESISAAECITTEAEFISVEAEFITTDTVFITTEAEFITVEAESMTAEAGSVIPIITEAEFIIITEAESITTEAESVENPASDKSSGRRSSFVLPLTQNHSVISDVMNKMQGSNTGEELLLSTTIKTCNEISAAIANKEDIKSLINAKVDHVKESCSIEPPASVKVPSQRQDKKPSLEVTAITVLTEQLKKKMTRATKRPASERQYNANKSNCMKAKEPKIASNGSPPESKSQQEGENAGIPLPSNPADPSNVPVKVNGLGKPGKSRGGRNKKSLVQDVSQVPKTSVSEKNNIIIEKIAIPSHLLLEERHTLKRSCNTGLRLQQIDKVNCKDKITEESVSSIIRRTPSSLVETNDMEENSVSKISEKLQIKVKKKIQKDAVEQQIVSAKRKKKVDSVRDESPPFLSDLSEAEPAESCNSHQFSSLERMNLSPIVDPGKVLPSVQGCFS